MSEWQPIETAPRDGTLIRLRFGEDAETVGAWQPFPDINYPWLFLEKFGSWPNDSYYGTNRSVDGACGPSHWAALDALRDPRLPQKCDHNYYCPHWTE